MDKETQKPKPIAIFSFTENGRMLEARLRNDLQGCFMEGESPLRAHTVAPYPRTVPLKEQVKAAFSECGALIFIGAAGIAVRLIAPHLKSKLTDPAVLVIDEAAHYVIPIVGGHIGGASELAEKIAPLLKAQAVITTATDINGVFAVDLWAKKNDLVITSTEKAKNVSAKLLAGGEILLESCMPITGTLPAGIKLAKDTIEKDEKSNLGIVVSYKKQNTLPENDRLHLIPRCVWLGIGCKRGKTAAEIECAVRSALINSMPDDTIDYIIDERSIVGIASIDIKNDEAGLRQFANERSLPLVFFTAAKLMAAKGSFSHSDFAAGVTGADNICERAAFLASDGGEIIIKKTAHNGVTVAAALKQKGLLF